MNELTKRTPELIGAEIRTITTQAKSILLVAGIEIGRRLTEAKELVQHGEWMDWLKDETGFSASTASRYMKLFEEYGAPQSSLFGAETNFSTLKNLSVSNALRLLAVPEEEREDFAKEHDAEHISARELEKIIKEKQEAEQRAELAEKALNEAEEGALLNLQEAETARDKLKEELKETKRSLRDVKEELKNRPVETVVQVDEKAVEAARKETEEKFRGEIQKLKHAVEDAEKEKAAFKAAADSAESVAQGKIAAAEKKATEAKAALAEAERKLRSSNSDLAAFKVYFETVQEDFKKLLAMLDRMDNEQGDKLRKAVKAVLNKLIADVEVKGGT